MHLLSDIITYIRRIIKSPSNAQITDNLLIDYINRFWISDVDARIQLFDLKTKYQFQTVPGVDQYNMPLYAVQTIGDEPDEQDISFYPVYQGFMSPAFVNGVGIGFHTERNLFNRNWSNYVQSMLVLGTGNGTPGPYNLQIPFVPSSNEAVNARPSGILRGHVDMTGIVASGNAPVDPIFASTLNLSVPTANAFPAVYLTSLDINSNSLVVSDSGQFLSLSGNNLSNWGLLMRPGGYPTGNTALTNGYQSTFAITGVTQAAQAVLTATTNFSVGELINIQGVVGMTQLNGGEFEVVAVTPTTVTINVNSLGFGAYVSGGTASSLRNVINYQTGEIRNVFFSSTIPQGQNINGQCYFYTPGMPMSVLFFNNILTFRTVPDKQYLVELDAYLTPAAFLTSAASIPFAYMCEYLARGAARKILSDTGDIEQFQFYEPLFREQEIQVWKRSQRQNTANRVPTIYSQGHGLGAGYGYGIGNQGVF